MRAGDLTVAIPTRGRSEILGRTLAGLAEQTVSGFETIVVLDGDGDAPTTRLDGVRLLHQPHSGPGAARNLAVGESARPLVLFLGDDMVPAADLVERHLERHAREPEREVAVLGRVRRHPQVPRSRLSRWLEWSGAQFDYRQLDREAGEEAGFGRFYSCNVSLKRELFTAVGGFDPDFQFDYEDLDLAWRLHQQGMVLRYEPRAVTRHLHRHDWESVQRRYESRARAERLMMRKHEWFRPWFQERISAQAGLPPASRLWPAAVDLVPPRLAPVRARVETRAERWYQQALADRFLAAWEGERGLEELRAYLGDAYDQSKLERAFALVDEEAAAAPDEATFYRTSELYLYDLTVFAMSGAKEPYRRMLASLLPPGARVLDYGCGIGSDGLRLLESGYRVAFADFDNPSVEYLRWRLKQRGLQAPVYDLDGEMPGGFDAAYAFDVIEHVDDPFGFLAALEARAGIVMVNLLEAIPGDTPLHRELPIRAILKHATGRGLLRYRRYHGRVHLIAYRGAAGPGARAERLRSAAERRLGPLRRG
jgi:GT2 family glycosyltransferase/2-polyprenyl-3-methyl-5-hydroxy-6-metoxy-1,4-benzoquinol methylase